MKAIYLDTFAGISGNMFLGALLDAGYPFECLKEELKKLNLGEYELIYQQVNKLGIEAKYFNVILPETYEHHHEHEHNHEHEHHHNHEHTTEVTGGKAVSLENIHEYNGVGCRIDEAGYCIVHKTYHQSLAHNDLPKHEHSLESIQEHNEIACIFDEEGNCLVHEHHHHDHEHEHVHEHHYDHDHEHTHNHVHSHSHENAELPHTHHHHEHRNLKAVMDIINNSDLSEAIKLKAESVFRAIAVAEGKVHGKPLEEVHFHEVGAIDTIIDIVGTLLGLEYLGIEKIYCGRINTGFGTVQCAHGLMPVPAPATAELLMGLPTEKGIVDKEMTTPTGAALVKVMAEIALQQPDSFVAEKIAYGAGSRECVIPNVLRMYVGYTEAGKQSLVEGACNIDDMTGEVLGYTLEKLMNSGLVKDVWAESIYMKKNRPAYKLCFLAEENFLSEIQKLLFKETSTLGIRYYGVERAELERRSIEVNIPAGKAAVKLGCLPSGEIKAAPEYEDCRKLAEATGLSLREVMEMVLAEAKNNG